MIEIVQRHPRRCSKYRFNHPLVIDRSPTNSLESFDNLASKERQILEHNHRVPKYEFVIHFLEVLDVPELKEKRDKIFGYLRKVGLKSVICIEQTDDGFGNPTDTVHFHGLTDDVRGVKYIRELCRTACLAAGFQDKETSGADKNEFDVECRELDEPEKYYAYFTKHEREEKVYLFVRGSRIQRFYFTGDWFIDINGNKINKGAIWDKIKEETRKRHLANKKRQSIKNNVGHCCPNVTERANQTKLKSVLDKETIRTLYDWHCILSNRPALFQTIPPPWFNTLQSQPLKRNDLLEALAERLWDGRELDYLYTMEVEDDFGLF